MTRRLPVFNFYHRKSAVLWLIAGHYWNIMSVVSNVPYARLKGLDLQERHLFPLTYNCAFTPGASDLCLGR